jgi:hypothetical protein
MNFSLPADIVLAYAGESLLCQVAAWVHHHQGFGLRLVSSRDPAAFEGAVADAARLVLDATEQPGAAMGGLERALTVLSPDRVAVYAETVHHGLELFVRVRGVPLLMGPLSPLDWAAFFKPLALTAAPLRLYASGRQKQAGSGWPE